MDPKSNLYYSTSIKNSELNNHSHTKIIFGKTSGVYGAITNRYAENILALTSATNGVKSYDYIAGWEAAKIVLPRICIDHRYIVRICLSKYSAKFIMGFYSYLIKTYANFETELDIVYQAGLLPSLKKSLEAANVQYKTLISAASMERIPKSDNHYEAVIACDYSLINHVHNKGYYMVTPPRKEAEHVIMYCGYIFKNVQLIDITILSEIFVLCNAMHHPTRGSARIAGHIPTSQFTRHGEDTTKKIKEDMNTAEILKTLHARQRMLDKFDYVSCWFACNEDFTKTAEVSTDILNFDAIDFSTENLHSNEIKHQDNNDENKS
jgi:hypothetical protein